MDSIRPGECSGSGWYCQPAGAALCGPGAFAYIGRDPSQYSYNPQPQYTPRPPRSSGNSAFQLGGLGCLVFIAIRLLLGLPGCFHAISTDVSRELQLSDVGMEALESSGAYTTVTWFVTIHNTGSKEHFVTVEAEFRDMGSIVLARDEVKEVAIAPGETLKFKDNYALTAASANRVDAIYVRVY